MLEVDGGASADRAMALPARSKPMIALNVNMVDVLLIAWF